jgi:uncharacterized Ntn-hydrolase superfamily protein
MDTDAARSPHRPGTFSIAAFDPATDAFGAAVATGTVAVGALCPYVSRDAAVLTQSYTRTEHGRDAVARVDAGDRVDDACRALLAADEFATYRQVHAVGRASTFAHTGADCVDWCGHRVADEVTVAGNMLADGAVVDAVADAFATDEGGGGRERDLPGRLVAALAAGAAAGGDSRGERSAALLVAAPEPELYHNLRVDWSTTPVADLADVLDEAREAAAGIRASTAAAYDDYPEGILEFGVKY